MEEELSAVVAQTHGEVGVAAIMSPLEGCEKATEARNHSC
jgi:hypothetical protein